MNDQVNQVITAFEEDNPGFTVQLDILPTGKSDREYALKKLRTQLMSGEGPDILLLPSCDARISYYDENTTIQRTQSMLLSDPIQSMRSGIFLDISEFYDNDEALNTEALQQQVMDAGTLGDARYILPLRYDFPAVYIYEEGVEVLGIDPEELEEGIISLLKATLAAGDAKLASGVLPSFCRTGGVFSLLPAAIDYEEEKVTLEAEELVEFLSLYQAVAALAAGNQDARNDPDLWNYVAPANMEWFTNEWGNRDYNLVPGDAYPLTVPATVETMAQSPNAAAIVQSEGGEGYRMVPLLAADGQLAAYVTYYGAITAGCDCPEEAYDFLRRFLLEENQWEQNRPLKTKMGDWEVVHQSRCIEDGWPVRNHGFIEKLWVYLRKDVYGGGDDAGKQRSRKIQRTSVTDEDIPLLDVQIDRVYFGNSIEQGLAEAIRGLNDEHTGEAIPTDLDALAEDFTNSLKYRLLEG